jgi:hypothetical protein
MSLFPTRALFLVAVLAGSLDAQAADNTQRTLTTEQVSFKLPAGWEWQSEIASNIAIKKDIKVKDETIQITADLVYQSEGFVEDTIKGIEKKVAISKGDLKDFKVTRGEKFAAAPATLVTYTRVRGEKAENSEDERQYLLRRNGALYTWTERARRSIAGQAQSAFAQARGALSFTTKDTAREPKVFADAGMKYVLPADFEYEKVGELPKGADGTTVIHVGTVVTVKGETWYVQCMLGAQKSTNALDDVEKQGKTIFEKNYEDMKDFKIVEKQTLRGEKALLMTFTGIQIGKDPNQPKGPNRRWQVWWFKRKGYIFNWQEAIPIEANPAVDAALKKGRDGLSWL